VPTTSRGALDTTLADNRGSTQRAVWATSDAGARITRVDPATGVVTAQVDVAERPGGLTDDARNLWAFHFLQGTVTRVDLATASATRLQVPGVRATGIAWDEGSLWLLTTQPSRCSNSTPPRER
jgi:streptogramin lyase